MRKEKGRMEKEGEGGEEREGLGSRKETNERLQLYSINLRQL